MEEDEERERGQLASSSRLCEWLLLLLKVKRRFLYFIINAKPKKLNFESLTGIKLVSFILSLISLSLIGFGF